MPEESSVLETEVTLKVPRGVHGRLRFFGPNQDETHIPLGGELGNGLISGMRLSGGLGILNTRSRRPLGMSMELVPELLKMAINFNYSKQSKILPILSYKKTAPRRVRPKH
jgi:hypothetical protein